MMKQWFYNTLATIMRFKIWRRIYHYRPISEYPVAYIHEDFFVHPIFWRRSPPLAANYIWLFSKFNGHSGILKERDGILDLLIQLSRENLISYQSIEGESAYKVYLMPFVLTEQEFAYTKEQERLSLIYSFFKKGDDFIDSTIY